MKLKITAASPLSAAVRLSAERDSASYVACTLYKWVSLLYSCVGTLKWYFLGRVWDIICIYIIQCTGVVVRYLTEERVEALFSPCLEHWNTWDPHWSFCLISTLRRFSILLTGGSQSCSRLSFSSALSGAVPPVNTNSLSQNHLKYLQKNSNVSCGRKHIGFN